MIVEFEMNAKLCALPRDEPIRKLARTAHISNTDMRSLIFAVIWPLFFVGVAAATTPAELRLGRAGHAFDHLGKIGEQAEAAAASGSTIIYATGLGSAGYAGLPPQSDFQSLSGKLSEYNRNAKSHGIELSIGYLCATSIVKLDTFDKNWTPEFRKQFETRPAEWRQKDRNGNPLASWYGGDYQPACMSNPDWRTYQRAMVRYQLETGHDGIFFDNPTVHPQGCYCGHCMRAFAKAIKPEALPKAAPGQPDRDEHLRRYADSHPDEFLIFRSTIARDFLAHIREFARTINPRALVTCNNSLNAPSVFYSQCRTHAYNINEMAKVEDLVVVEDMNNQPRTEANGQTIEYGPTYKMLHAISHGRPVVAVTVAGADYHTPPNLMRLAMAEAAAHDASYLSWPTWPEAQRERMIKAVRPQADFLRRNAGILNDAPIRQDVALYLPFQRWLKTDQCAASALATALTRENIQYRVVAEDELDLFAKEKHLPPLLVESRSVFTSREQPAVATIEKAGPGMIAADQPDWLANLRRKIASPSVTVTGPPTVRAVVHDQPNRTVVHLYNLNVQRLSSFEDKITPATNVRLTLSLPYKPNSANLDTADENNSAPKLKLEHLTNKGRDSKVALVVPRLDVSAIITIEP
jgi:hypothetical protein